MKILFVFRDAGGNVHLGGCTTKEKKTVTEHYKAFIDRYIEEAVENYDILAFVEPKMLHAIAISGDAIKLLPEDAV